MALYLGHDINNKPLLHLTASSKTTGQLVDNQYPDTLFHSSRENISYTRYANVGFRTSFNGSYEWGMWFFTSNTLPESVPTIIDVPTAVYNAALAGKGIHFIINTSTGSFLLRPTTRFSDPFTFRRFSIPYQGMSSRTLQGSVAWFSETNFFNDPIYGTSLPYIAPIPIPEGVTNKVCTLLPSSGVTSIDIIVLNWGYGYLFTPDIPAEIKVEAGDIKLGSNALSNYKYIRTGPSRIDTNNQFIPIRRSNSLDAIQSFELMNDPTPTGSTLELTPSKIVVKGRAVADSSKTTKTTQYKRSSKIQVSEFSASGSVVTRKHIIAAKGTFKPSDTIALFYGAPSISSTEFYSGRGFYGPFKMSERVLSDTHLSYSPSGYWTQYNFWLETDSNGDYVLTAEAGTQDSSATIVVRGFELSFLIFPEG